MNHSKVRDRLSGYLERDLSSRDRSRVSAHLGDCPECSRELRELEAMRRLLRRLPEPEAPPALVDSVMARIRAGEAEPASLGAWLRRLTEPALAVPAAAGFAAALLLLLAVQGVVEGPSPGLQATVEPAPATRIATAAPEPVEAAPTVDELEVEAEKRQYVREMQRRSAALQLARRARPMDMARILRGAGHPSSPTFAAHFEERDHAGFTTVNWSPR